MLAPVPTVKILNQLWKFEEVDERLVCEKWAWIDWTILVIFYRHAPTDLLKENLLHEIIHAINASMQLNEGPSDEEIASRMSVAMLTFARDNLQLAQWLFCSH